MEAAFGMRALKDLFGFPFRDEKKGMKFLIGSLVFISAFFIPLLPWIALLGYAARMIRESIAGHAARLPEWTDWANLLLDGLKLSLVLLLLSLPALVIFFLGFGSYFASFFGAVMMEAIGGESAAAPFFMFMIFAMFFMFLAMTVGTLLSVAAWFLFPPLAAHVVATGRVSAVFELRSWGRLLRANLGGYTLVFFAMFGLWALQYLVFYLLYMTIVLCFFTPVVVAPITIYMLAIASVMTGQSYREALEKIDQPAAG